MSNPQDMRRNYTQAGLDEADAGDDPIALFTQWFQQAVEVQTADPAACWVEPNAMTLATADASGTPSARIVLLKGFGAEGFCFYTNHDSRKGQELAATGRAALVFYWGMLERQVRIEGLVQRMTQAEAEAYFHARPRSSQIGAWASPQSEVIPDRDSLQQRVAEREKQFGHPAAPIPIPDHWGGYRVVPQMIEFWQGRPSRLHDRLRFTRDGSDPSTWQRERLAP